MRTLEGSVITDKVRLLNVDIDNITMDELLTTFREGMLMTLHVNMIMKLQKDREFWELLPEFDIITCDSQILMAAARLLGTPLQERVSGSDFFPLFCDRHAQDPSVTIFLCGGMPGVADTAKERINERIGREIVVGVYSPSLDFHRRPDEIDRIIDRINMSEATVLVLGIDAGRQEKFLVCHRHRFTHAKTFLPLGGTIDYEAGTLKRPAPWVTNVGLEWLYRLVLQPRRRWRRYLVHDLPVLRLLALQAIGRYCNPFK